MKYIFGSGTHRYEAGENNYWETNSSAKPVSCPPLQGDTVFDVAVIGAGITGLNAALSVVRGGLSVGIIDARLPGWGASGRNGGFVCLGGSQRTDESLARQYGVDAVREFREIQKSAINAVSDRIDRQQMSVDRHSDGEWELAHSRYQADVLRRRADSLHKQYKLECTFHEKKHLADLGMEGPDFHAALHIPLGFAIDPRKYVNGLITANLANGVSIFADSPVESIERQAGAYKLLTPDGGIRAKKLLVACNGYTADRWIGWLSGRYLPAVSNVLVTERLSTEQLSAQGWHSPNMASDSRQLLHYFRLMPNGRFLFGMRGGTALNRRVVGKAKKRINQEFERMFPAWKSVPRPYFWSGLLCLTRHRTLYAGPVGDWPNAWTALAYHGNGVAMGSWCGQLLGDLATGHRQESDIPQVMRGPLLPFPLPGMRRHYLKIAYGYYNLRDRFR